MSLGPQWLWYLRKYLFCGFETPVISGWRNRKVSEEHKRSGLWWKKRSGISQSVLGERGKKNRRSELKPSTFQHLWSYTWTTVGNENRDHFSRLWGLNYTFVDSETEKTLSKKGTKLHLFNNAFVTCFVACLQPQFTYRLLQWLQVRGPCWIICFWWK